MEIKIETKTLIRIFTVATLFVGLILIIKAIMTPLIWLSISLFLALALEPTVKRLSKYMPWKSRGLALSIIFVFMIGVIAFVIISLAPPLISETTQLVKEAPDTANEFINDNNPVSNYLRDSRIIENLSRNQGEYIQKAVDNLGATLEIVFGILSSFLGLITILVFTFFMVLEGPKAVSLFWKYQPADKKEHRMELARKMHRTVIDYVNGNIFTSFIAGIVTSIVLWILGVPFVFALGILVAIFDLIPLIGATLAAVIITILTLIFAGIWPGVIVLIYFLVYQQIENNLLQPLVYSKSVKISPLVVGIAGLLGAVLAGLIGALVAVPVAASLQILVIDYLENQKAAKKTAD